MTDPEVLRIEVDLVIKALYERFGLDFRQYSRASLERRLQGLTERLGLEQVSELIPRLLHEPGFLDQAVNGIAVNVTEPFRDPECFAAIREQVFPVLRTYSYFKIWHAGCASGEEVYSMAILLKEAGLLDRAQIYATDINTDALARARDGIYPAESIARGERNYLAAGGAGRLADYTVQQYGSARFDASLRENMVFSQHNIVSDEVFGEMVLIMCRNVMIYFERDLQNRVIDLFHRSLARRGFLALGAKESLLHLSAGQSFQTLDRVARLYRAI